MTVATTTAKKFDMRKALSEGTTPVYATIGMTDLAIERVREVTLKASETAEKNRVEISELPAKVSALPAKAQEQAAKIVADAQDAPAKARELAEKLQASYEELAISPL